MSDSKNPVIGKMPACGTCGQEPEIRQASRRGHHFYLHCGCGWNQSQGAPLQQRIWDKGKFLDGQTVRRPSNVKDKPQAALESLPASEPEAEPVEPKVTKDFDPSEPESEPEPTETAPAEKSGLVRFLPAVILLAAGAAGALWG